ncbi:hypothetical protein [Streptomyces sp. NPDC015350]|uniref:hypothetical protein n=1 Tax=Streptomyces sp. NPDC015350 TaxID=3364955 RepID=UPI0036FAE4BA
MNATETAPDRAGRLGLEIWLSLLPHDPAVPDAPRRRKPGHRPADEFRLTPVTDSAQLRPRDLILALHNQGYEADNKNIMAVYTIREAVRERESAVCLVGSVDATAVMVHEYISIPLGGWGSCDPAQFGQPWTPNVPPAHCPIPSRSRTIARLGNLDDFLPAVHEHPDYPTWLASYAEAERQDTTRLHRPQH